MLGVVNRLPPLRLHIRNRITNHRQILFQRYPQHLSDMQVPRLTHNRTHRRFRTDQRLHPNVFGRRDALAASHPEGTHSRMLQRQLCHSLKKFFVLRIRKRIATLNIVKTQLVQPLSNHQLVLQREVHAFTLRTIAERCVVELNSSHDRSCFQRLQVPTKKPSGDT